MNPERARLHWRCRRGMLELDLLLQGFVTRGYDQLTVQGRTAFEGLLKMPDNDLLALIYGEAKPADSETAHVVDAIRRAAAP